MKNCRRCERLKNIIDDILWMAIRYAHGRRTYAPSVVRQAVKNLRRLYPDFKLKDDIVIAEDTYERDKKRGIAGMREDYLNDLFDKDEFEVSLKEVVIKNLKDFEKRGKEEFDVIKKIARKKK